MDDTLVKQFLPYVEKPDRYIGQEIGLPKLPEQPELRVALAFPDTYELGMSYLGMRILYHLGNQVKGVACERVFMPWFDAVERLRENGIPLFTLETCTPLRKLDLLGFHLQYELHATNVLAMMHLGGIPIFAEDRAETTPIVLGGGSLTSSPEPLARFFDAFALGDGEELWKDVLEILKQGKKKGLSRAAKIRSLGDIPGIYLPHYYVPDYSKTGKYLGLKRRDSDLPARLQSRITPHLSNDYYPLPPIVPTLEATHNRLILEVARGCSRGCRFCQPGMINRPVRERSVADLIRAADRGLASTGYSEVSLLSLSTADYRALEPLLEGLQPVLKKHHASLSFPSLRPDKFTPQMAQRAADRSRTGLTFAPEAATARLRGVINKQTSDDALLKAAQLAFEKGWQLIKLYFMIGLPTETDDDINALVDLVKNVDRIRRAARGKKINVSLSPFSPKPHTPFQREKQLLPEAVRRRYHLLKNGLKKHRAVRLEMRRPEISLLETALIRGDRATGDVIAESYRRGGLFDAWSDGFNAQRWIKAFLKSGLDITRSADVIPDDQILPWDHIDVGITAAFLDAENKMASAGRFTPDCRELKCHYCGLQERDDLPCPDIPPVASVTIPSSPPNIVKPAFIQRLRLVYRRTEKAKYHSHLSIIAAFERALRRLQVPLEYTAGFKPHLRLIASPPLSVGLVSQSEYLDFGSGAEWSSDLFDRLKNALPQGVEPVKVIALQHKQPSIGALNVFLYRAQPLSGLYPEDMRTRCRELLARDNIPIVRSHPQRERIFDARPSLWKCTSEEGVLLIGLESVGGPMPRPEEIIRQLFPDVNRASISTDWKIERSGMWWNVNEQLISPESLQPVENSV